MSKPPQTALTVFAALPRAAHDARVVTMRVLSGWELSDLAETAVLVVSELVTNSIRHAGGVMDPPQDLTELVGRVAPVMLGLSHRRESLLVQVWDQSSTPPLRRVAADDADGGRGLALVEMLSKEWGCEVLDTGGKIVWAVLETGHL